MAWQTIVALLSALAVPLSASLTAVLVARRGSQDKREERQHADVWQFIAVLQGDAKALREEITGLRDQIHRLQADSEDDQRTIAGHERTIASQGAEIVALRARLAALEGGC